MQGNETINYKYYLQDKSYKDKSRLVEYWDQMQDFYEGNQIPLKFQSKIGTPAFVGNICKYLVNTKASKLRGTPYVITFQSANAKATDKLDKFDKFVLQDIRYETELQLSIINALIYGTEVILYRFDDSAVSLDAVYEGKMVREHVDLRRFAVANPYLPSIQKQEWLMYWNTQSVKAIRNRCRKMKDETDKEFEARKAKILPDDYTEQKYPRPEDVAFGMATVFTRYFRKNGEVCYQSSTQTAELFDPTFISPKAQKIVLEMMEKDLSDDLGNKVDDYDIDTQVLEIEADKDKMTDREYQDHLGKFSLYPFADYTPNRRFNHFYGISDLQDAIAAQKIINFVYSMSAKQIQENAWGKWIAKEGALRGQTINNDGGQLLIDYSKNNTFGIQRSEANSGNILNITKYAEDMFALVRTVYGATETITGETASQLSGYAISLLQEQGNTVFEMHQSQLWNDFAVSEAAIRLQYYLHYYDTKTNFIYEMDDVEFSREEASRNQQIENDLNTYAQNRQAGLNVEAPNPNDYPEIQRISEQEFSSDEVNQFRYYILPKAGRGIKYSEVVQADQINQLFKDGTIANMPVWQQKAYMELNPLIDETTKSKYSKIIQEQEMSENARLSEQVQQLTQNAQEQQVTIQRLQTVISQQNSYITNLESQFKQKLNAAKAINDNQEAAINQAEIDSMKSNKKSNSSSSSTGVSDEVLSEGVKAALK